MAREFAHPNEMHKFVGQEIGVSDWVEVTQERIDQFAEATGDHQWIHVDVERAKKDMPGGKTIAHGFLTLSLIRLQQGALHQPGAGRVAGAGSVQADRGRRDEGRRRASHQRDDPRDRGPGEAGLHRRDHVDRLRQIGGTGVAEA
jgi:MaoC like domain